MFAMLKQSVQEFMEDDCPAMAAALSYYTVFSLPPLLLLLLLLVGSVMDPGDVRGTLELQLRNLLGPGAGSSIRTILENAEQPGRGLAAVVGVVVLAIGATGVFGQLQAALNRAWEVEPDPAQGGLKNFLMKRVFSFGMILALAFLLLVSLVLSAIFSAFGDALVRIIPGAWSGPALQAVNFGVSFALIALLFAAIFKVLPDATISWRDVRVGAVVTALLFVIGKTLLGIYLGHSDPGEAFGAAGSLALLLVWIYYSSMTVLLGAEFTQVWAERRGKGIQPEPGAIRAVRQKQRLGEAH